MNSLLSLALLSFSPSFFLSLHFGRCDCSINVITALQPQQPYGLNLIYFPNNGSIMDLCCKLTQVCGGESRTPFIMREHQMMIVGRMLLQDFHLMWTNINVLPWTLHRRRGRQPEMQTVYQSCVSGLSAAIRKYLLMYLCTCQIKWSSLRYNRTWLFQRQFHPLRFNLVHK